MILVLIKASLFIVVVFAFYKLFLEKESFFATNRIYLILGLAFAFVLPFVGLPELVRHQGIVGSLLTEMPVVNTANPSEVIKITEFNEAKDYTLLSENKVWYETKSISFWLLLIYFLGVVLFLLNFLSQLYKIRRNIKRSSEQIKEGEFTVVSNEDRSGPCSFFNYIFINPSLYDKKTYQQILAHEKVHARKKHSVDFLIAELAIVVLWFNPVIWLFRKEIEKNCEYETDAILLDKQVVEPHNYQMSLLKIATDIKPLKLVSNYNQSLIKKRIIMMNKQKSKKNRYFKYAFIAPILFAALLVLNQPFMLKAQEPLNFHNEDGYSEKLSHHGEHSDDLPLFHRAVAEGDEVLVREMLADGANVNEIALGDGTPLYLALQHDHWKIAKLLLKTGADPNIGSRADGYPVLLAVMIKDPELIQLLVKYGADFDTDFPGDGNAMIQAAKNGDLNMVMTLVDLKVDINRGVKGDGNPLIMASKAGQLHVVKYLVDRGADVNYEVEGDEVPVINASEQGHLDVVKFLVENGADVNKVCKEVLSNGTIRIRTALNIAIEKGHEDVAAYLISKGSKN